MELTTADVTNSTLSVHYDNVSNAMNYHMASEPVSPVLDTVQPSPGRHFSWDQ